MIDNFTREQFEAVLPKSATYLGLREGEHTYLVPAAHAYIMVRSSIRADGYNAEAGKDSIRVWLVDSASKPLGSKIARYITRVPGWQRRLTEMLDMLTKLAEQAGTCSQCGKPRGVYKTKKEGRLFVKCFTCNEGFRWIGV